MTRYLPWRSAMAAALYGPAGFFVRPGAAPARHFRTSVHASALFAGAVTELLHRVDAALDHPQVLDFVDVGAGGGELVAALAGELPGRLRLWGVDLAPRPAGLPAAVRWVPEVPPCAGLLFANEWLDNIPLDVVQVDDAGGLRQVLVTRDGSEQLGGPASETDAAWLRRWWPVTEPGERAEPGWPRDQAWAAAVSRLERGLAVAVDYGHLAVARPAGGSLTGYAAGRQVPPVPDGSCDLTAHVAVDSLGGAALLTQRDTLRALGVTGARPPLALAGTDPVSYLRALAAAGEAGELRDSAGLGAFWWVVSGVDLPPGAIGAVLG